MYRLLIVDDLPIIVDGLLELFEKTEHLELEVMKAYSGEEALEVMSHHRMDIVISDIKMSGIEASSCCRKSNRSGRRAKLFY